MRFYRAERNSESVGYLLVFHVVKIAEFENFLAFVRQFVNRVIDFFAKLPVFNLLNHFVVVRLIELCTPLVDFFHGGTVTVFHVPVFQNVEGTGIDGTIEKGLTSTITEKLCSC